MVKVDKVNLHWVFILISSRLPAWTVARSLSFRVTQNIETYRYSMKASQPLLAISCSALAKNTSITQPYHLNRQ